MTEYEVQQVQKKYGDQIAILKNSNVELNEKQQATLFAKLLVKQTTYSDEDIVFCDDNELFISKTPTGCDVVGYYKTSAGTKSPFNVTVCKINGIWYPSKRYVAADTKSCSSYIFLWFLISLGCTLMGILMYYLISASIGI
ncbi:MAG: hypothetical protein IJD97_02020 [Clostridia bacterium]|nr:hypothetical protein [Clostridia bacterium]